MGYIPCPMPPSRKLEGNNMGFFPVGVPEHSHNDSGSEIESDECRLCHKFEWLKFLFFLFLAIFGSIGYWTIYTHHSQPITVPNTELQKFEVK